MLKISAILLLLLSLNFVEGNKKKRVGFVDGVAVLTTDNFNDYIRAYKYAFVKFYAPWCGHCKQMAPGYAALAKKLKGNPDGIQIAKLDATVEGEIAETYKVKSFPMLFFFMNGEPIEYNGERDQEHIEAWIYEQIKYEVPKINDLEEIKKIEESKISAILGCQPDDKALMAKIRVLALSNRNVPFYITHNSQITEHFGCDDLRHLILIRSFDDGNKVLKLEKGSQMKAIRSFWNAASKPLVSDLEETAQEIFSNKIPSIVFFSDNFSGPAYDKFYELAKKKQGVINFVRSGIENGEMGKKISGHIGLKQYDQNVVRILSFSGSDIKKFRPTDVSMAGLIQFIDDFKADKLKPYLKSQPLPKVDKRPVKTIVADNFDDIVLKSNQYVLLEIYAPWCKHCQQLQPVFEQLGKKLAKVPELIIAKYDGTENEHPMIKVQGYPVIYLYKLRQKKKPIEYKGARTFQALVNFLEKELDRDLIFPEDMETGDEL